MSQTTVKVQIQQRIDTSSNWTSAGTTVLLSGEIGWESDTKKYKIGDGSTAWSSLAYAPGSGGYTAGNGVSISASNVISASAIALSTIQTAANETAMLALTTQEGDVVVRSDQSKTYMKNNGTAGSMADFTELATPTDAVTSVNGNTGAITADQLAAAIESATDSNTFTDADHTKLDGIATGAEVNVQSDWNETSNSSDAYIQNKPTIPTNTNTTYAISCVDGDNTDEEKIRLTAGGSGSGTDDIVLEAGTGLSIARSSDKITFTNTVTNTDTQLTEEQVEDFVGGMLTGNTETGITVTYQDSDGTIDFVVDSQTDNNFTTTLKNKLDGIAANATNVTNNNQLTNGAGYVTTDTNTTYDLSIPSGTTKLRLDPSDSSGNDDVEIAGGTNVTVTRNNGNKLTISATDTNTTYSVGDGGLTQNNFTDALKNKLDGIESSATADQTASEIVALVADQTIAPSEIEMGDGEKIKLGNSYDLELFHDSSSGANYIDSVNRSLIIRRTGTETETMAQFTADGAVELYWGGTSPGKKVETTSGGVTVTGTISAGAASFTDDGSAGPVINISGDDANLWYGRIGNESYHDNLGTGLKFYVTDSGDAVFQHTGNSEYRNYYFSQNDGTTSRFNIYVNTAGAVFLYHGSDYKLQTTSSGVTVTGSVSDTKGDVRSIPENNQTSAYTLVASDAGKMITMNAGGLTVPNGTLSKGDAVSIINQSGSDQTITQGSGLTLYNTADGSTGNRTLAGRGMATMWFVANDAAYISGAGLS